MFVKYCLLLIVVLLWPALLAAEKSSASLEIRATVPSYCKFKVDTSPAKSLKLDEIGAHKAHIANINLDCNIVSGYRIVANSKNSFHLTSAKNELTIPYKIIIDTLGEAKEIDPTSQFFEPEISTKSKVYGVYLLYEVTNVMAGEYNDHVEFLLDIG